VEHKYKLCLKMEELFTLTQVLHRVTTPPPKLIRWHSLTPSGKISTSAEG